jgi:hypothetical protein
MNRKNNSMILLENEDLDDLVVDQVLILEIQGLDLEEVLILEMWILVI